MCAQVLTVREILQFDVDTSITARIKLERMAMKALKYVIGGTGNIDDLEECDRKYVTDEYKVRRRCCFFLG